LRRLQVIVYTLCHCFKPLTIYRAPSHPLSQHPSSNSSSEPTVIFNQDIHLRDTCYQSPSYSLQLLPVHNLVDHLDYTYLPILPSSIQINHGPLPFLLKLPLLLAVKLPRQATNVRRYVSILLLPPLPAPMKPDPCPSMLGHQLTYPFTEREHERMRREQRRREQKPPIVSQDRDRRVPTDNQGFPIISKNYDAGYRR